VVNRPGSERRWPATLTGPEDLKIQSHCFTRGRLSKGVSLGSSFKPKWYLSPDTEIAEDKKESRDGLSSAFRPDCGQLSSIASQTGPLTAAPWNAMMKMGSTSWSAVDFHDRIYEV
jgi:hypothetical protein